MKNISILLFFLLSILSFAIKANDIKNIKLAIFDNPKIDPINPIISEKLETAYMQGITTAISVAKVQNISIESKPFFTEKVCLISCIKHLLLIHGIPTLLWDWIVLIQH